MKEINKIKDRQDLPEETRIIVAIKYIKSMKDIKYLKGMKDLKELKDLNLCRSMKERLDQKDDNGIQETRRMAGIMKDNITREIEENKEMIN
jgi:hypothetical protein